MKSLPEIAADIHDTTGAEGQELATLAEAVREAVQPPSGIRNLQRAVRAYGSEIENGGDPESLVCRKLWYSVITAARAVPDSEWGNGWSVTWPNGSAQLTPNRSEGGAV